MALSAMEQQMRFCARNSIASMGQNHGETAAIDAAKGFIRGCVDELVTMLGPDKAYEIATQISERALELQAREHWAKNKT